jgi:hypothetical protein
MGGKRTWRACRVDVCSAPISDVPDVVPASRIRTFVDSHW